MAKAALARVRGEKDALVFHVGYAIQKFISNALTAVVTESFPMPNMKR